MNRIVLISIALVISLGPVVRAHGDETDAKRIRALFAQRINSIVLVRADIELSTANGGQSQKQEGRAEVTGSYVDASGLVMIGDLHAQGMMNGGKAQMSPSNFTVTFPPSQKEHSAALVATDPVLHVAFLKVSDLGADAPTVIDFSQSVDPMVGDEAFALSRIERGFDYAPFVNVGVIVGEINKPRHAFIAAGALEQGLPIFNEDGAVVGIIAPIAASDLTPTSGFMIGNHNRGETNSDGQGGSFLVSGKDVAATISQVLAHVKQTGANQVSPAPTPSTTTPTPAAK